VFLSKITTIEFNDWATNVFPASNESEKLCGIGVMLPMCMHSMSGDSCLTAGEFIS